MIKKVAGLLEPEVIVHNRGQILDGIAGVGEEKAIQQLTMSLENEFQAELDDRTNIRLQMSIRMADLQGRVPDFNRDGVQSPENFLRVVSWKNPEKTPSKLLLLRPQIYFSILRRESVHRAPHPSLNMLASESGQALSNDFTLFSLHNQPAVQPPNAALQGGLRASYEIGARYDKHIRIVHSSQRARVQVFHIDRAWIRHYNAPSQMFSPRGAGKETQDREGGEGFTPGGPIFHGL
jgi:hypothetical protein